MPKLVTRIGLDYLDKHISDFSDDESLAVFLGSYAAKGKLSPSGKAITIASKKQECLKRLETAMDNLDIGFTEEPFSRDRRIKTVYVRKKHNPEIYSDAKDFCGKYDASPFLDAALEYFERVQ